MPDLTMSEVNDRMLALEKQYPQWCKRRLLETWTPYANSYYLEVTNGVDPADIDVDTFTIPTGKRAVLFVSAQEGNETRTVRALFDATADLLAAAVIANAAVPSPIPSPPPAPPVAAPTVSLPSGQVFAPADVNTILNTLDILVIPVANQRGYPTYRAEGALGKVDVNRDYPVLWNAQRLNSAGAWTPYFFGNKTPTNWNPPNPGLGSAPCSAQTTKNLLKLMRKRVQTLINLAEGYGRNVMYPWGFWENSTTAPLNPSMRYCNPAFGTGTPAIIPGAPLPTTVPPTAPYVEYMPATSLARLQAAASAAVNAANAISASYWSGQATQYALPVPAPGTGFATPTQDPTGGGSIDYFFSLDICNRIALHFEIGGSLMTPVQASMDVTAIMFGLLKHLAGLGTADTTASTVTGVAAPDLLKEQQADWARTPTCP